jgi:hypothetical protein
MKKVILAMVFVLGMITTTMGNSDSNLIEQVELEPNPDTCFDLGAQIFFYLVEEGMHPNQANDAAIGIETLCNLLI